MTTPAVYPEIEPYERGMLDVGDGNRVYWETCGNPGGKPALVLHGGPGSGCSAGLRRYFDPDSYRIVLFDQRNCGRSTPHASDPAVSLAANTTAHLIRDIEALREHLGVTRWLVFGGSWGCVLGLAYAEAFPHHVSEMVLTGLATGRRAEVSLLTRGLGQLFPQAWQRYQAGVPESDRDGSMPAAYSRLLNHPDAAVRESAAQAWCDWEVAILPTSPPHPRYADPLFRLSFARLVTHYWSNDHFLQPDGVLLTAASRLGAVPSTLIQGSLDLVNLVGTPWLLAAAWPGSELVLIDDAGHGGSARLQSAIVSATHSYALPGGGRG